MGIRLIGNPFFPGSFGWRYPSNKQHTVGQTMHTHLKTIMNGSPYVVAVGSSSRAVAFAVLLVALAAQAHYMLPEIETVPTDRLIANLEKKLAAGSSESALLGPGEEIKI